jgi:hypothetical protein
VKLGLAFGLWLAAAVIAVANGFFSKAYVTPRLGEYGAHVYKSLLMVAVIFMLGWVYARQTEGTGWLVAALGAGLLWLGVTVIFEFVFGHYVFGNPWDKPLADYQIWRGRLWCLVLLADLIAPLTMGWMLNR